MLKLIISVIGWACLAGLLGVGESLKCYHCFDSFNTTLSFRASEENTGPSFVRCAKNINNWNTWICPREMPICVIISGKVGTHYEVLRTCAEDNFCSKYKPPQGVKVDDCQECNTTLCNDFFRSPTPPADPDALFIFNININLKLNKYSNISDEDLK